VAEEVVGLGGLVVELEGLLGRDDGAGEVAARDEVPAAVEVRGELIHGFVGVVGHGGAGSYDWHTLRQVVRPALGGASANTGTSTNAIANTNTRASTKNTNAGTNANTSTNADAHPNVNAGTSRSTNANAK